MSKPFIFPKGIRFPQPEEIGNNPEREAILDRLRGVSIQTGYVLSESNHNSYRYYSELNVSAPDVWNVFTDLCSAILPPKASVILGEKGQDEHQFFYSPPLSTETLVALLAPFEMELTHDGHIQFGAIHHEDDVTEEIFVHPSKYFTVWTNDLDSFRAVMAKWGIPEASKLSFIDEFPRVTLADYPGRTREFREVIAEIQSKFPVFLKK